MNRDDITRMAREAGISESHAQGMQGFLEAFATLVAAAEREACAKLCEELDAMTWSDFGEYSSGYADDIRARGQK